MSHQQITEARRRLHRSELAVPGSRPELFEKAAASRADYVFLDLEDAVAPDEKEAARRNVIEALRDVDWRGSNKTISVRINGLDTHYMYRDLIDVVERAGAHVDTILVPKVGVPGDIYTVDALLTQLEQAMGLSGRIGVEALVETALGMANVEAVAASSPRLEALHFGVADYAASCRARTITIGGLNPDYPGDQWHSALSRMLVACRANGLRAIDGPFGDFGDPDGFIAGARRAAALGYEGKWAIHPAQIDLANEVFTPPESEVDQARRVLQALEEAAAAGRGAAQLDGRMIDAASARDGAQRGRDSRGHREQGVLRLEPADDSRTESARRGVHGDPRIPSQGHPGRLRRVHTGGRSGLQSRAGHLSSLRDRRRTVGGEGPDPFRGPGQAGGIKLCSDEREVWEAADDLLGKRLVTHQTGERGRGVYRLYVEAAVSRRT